MEVVALSGETAPGGTTVSYTFSVKNTGDTTDTFSLSLSGNGWPGGITSAASITLVAGARSYARLCQARKDDAGWRGLLRLSANKGLRPRK